MQIFMSIKQAKDEEILRLVRTLQNDLYLSKERKKVIESKLEKLIKERSIMVKTLEKYIR
tara:strand:- start:945 stop:1124 length:180 start_codon:yes stop_codon:yes gene_type:complete